MNKYINRRILVISHNSFSDSINNGKTLESLFKLLPKENIAQLFFSENENPDFDFCNNYFKITDTDVLISLLSYKNKKVSRLTRYEEKNTNNKKSSLYKKVWNYLKEISSYIITFRDLLWKTGRWKSSSLFKWIEEFNPDVIFYCGGNSGFSHEIAVFLKKKYNIPLITYFTDDYLINPIPRNILDKIQRSRMKKFYKKTVDNSSLLFVIGDLMAEEYSAYFKRTFYPIMNSVPNDKFDFFNDLKNKNKTSPKDTLRITYFGGLHLNRWEMISHLGEIIKNNINSFNIKPYIEVFTNTPITTNIKDNFDKNEIIIKKPLSGDELIKEMVNSDILLHVESDDKYYKSLTKLSVSTKLPEYLLTKNFILGFGPQDVASMKLLSQNNIGKVVDSNESEEFILSYIINIINNENLRLEMGLKGYNFARQKFNHEVTRTFFMEQLNLSTLNKRLFYSLN